jgi:hypothetical protein
MKDSDDLNFAKILTRTLKLYPFADTTADTIDMWFEGFKKFPLEAIAAALNRHVFDPVKGGKQPMPSDIMAYLVGRAGEWLSPDEAWARAALAHDDRNTVVMCDQIRDALATVKHLVDAGDTFNAPRAFKDAYARNVDAARLKQSGPRWYVSPGYDAQQRLQVTQKAVEDGFIVLADGRASVPMLAGPGDVAPVGDDQAKIGQSRIADVLAILRAPKEKQTRDKSPDMVATDEERERQQREADEYMKGTK